MSLRKMIIFIFVASLIASKVESFYRPPIGPYERQNNQDLFKAIRKFLEYFGNRQNERENLTMSKENDSSPKVLGIKIMK